MFALPGLSGSGEPTRGPSLCSEVLPSARSRSKRKHSLDQGGAVKKSLNPRDLGVRDISQTNDSDGGLT